MTTSTITAPKTDTIPVKAAPKPAPIVGELSLRGNRAARAFDRAKRAMDAAKVEKEKAEAILREELEKAAPGATVGTIKGKKIVTLIGGSNTSFDPKMLQEAYPEAYAATIKKTSYDYPRVTIPA